MENKKGRTDNQKVKLMVLRDYLLENTDENHSVTTKEIESSL